jgi:hypothetical protein
MLLRRLTQLLLLGLAVATVSLLLLYLNITSGAFSIGLNFALMFWFTILEAQFKPALDSPYFDAHPFEKQGKIYRWLGVEWYRAILLKIGWETIRQQQTPINKSHQHLQAYERATRVSEMGHLLIGIVVLLVTGYVMVTHSVLAARWLILSNILLNGYPVLLQRYTRPRLRRLLARFGAAATSRQPDHSLMVPIER